MPAIALENFIRPLLEVKKLGQIRSFERIYVKPPDIRRIHIREFEDGRIECEDETLLPNHFGFIVKPRACPSEIIQKIERCGYRCLHEKNKTVCYPKDNEFSSRIS